MTDASEAIDAAGLAMLRHEFTKTDLRFKRSLLESFIPGIISLVDAQAARIAELKAERAQWVTFEVQPSANVTLGQME